ncbi:hypothetical protein [Scleromatobacter humisilvae]|uniref:Uncharacterized protein n=1 Tax=Scleromatobacter humisilvae TaxID=2897159 RepID=A0A9X1YMJ8_9BURK|nr:hypothetical protein [Scleromatobacter humisilvae]MCK9688928.1 hypothetical protein [Scleromatobacter humisilvae]
MSAIAKLKASAQLLAAALVALAGAAVAATAVGHAIDPEHIGLWSGPEAFFFGIVRGATVHGAHQLPASTLYIVAVMVVGICGFVVRELLGFARAGLARQAR